jgi:hypothetical protein
MRAHRHKRLIVSVLVLFLATHLVCVCATAAATTLTRAHSVRTHDPHGCCHPGNTAPTHHESAPRCAHCSRAELANMDTFRLAPPAPVLAAAVLVPTAPAHASAVTRRRTDGPAPDDPSRNILARTCTLRL